LTGIQESLKGGEMKPTLKLLDCWGSSGVAALRGGDWTSVVVDDAVEFAVIGMGVGVARGDGGDCVSAERKRWAVFRRETRRGTSLDERVYRDGTCRLNTMMRWALLDTG